MNINQIKEKYTCLDYLGDRVVRKTSTGYLARAPWREDAHPSLTVTLNGKGWKDQSTGEHGSIIDLVMRCLNTKDVQRVLDELGTTNLSPFDQQKILGGSKEKGKGFAFIEVMPLQSWGLFAYLHNRCINTEIAKRFLKEAHYGFEVREDGHYLYALAYGNDKGGYELRSGSYKGSTHPKWITTHLDIENAPTVVFEGFMDMLSFATLCGEVRHNYIVLNSIVNIEAGIEALRLSQNQVYLALDNDEGGSTTTKTMLDALPSAVDIRERFAPAKDVNDYLVNGRDEKSNNQAGGREETRLKELDEENDQEEEAEQTIRRRWRC